MLYLVRNAGPAGEDAIVERGPQHRGQLALSAQAPRSRPAVGCTPCVSRCQSRYTEQGDSLVLRFTADDVAVVAVATDGRTSGTSASGDQDAIIPWCPGCAARVKAKPARTT